MEKGTTFQLDTVSVRLVKDAPLFSNKRIKCPEDAMSSAWKKKKYILMREFGEKFNNIRTKGR